MRIFFKKTGFFLCAVCFFFLAGSIFAFQSGAAHASEADEPSPTLVPAPTPSRQKPDEETEDCGEGVDFVDYDDDDTLWDAWYREQVEIEAANEKPFSTPFDPAPKQIVITFVGDCTLGNTPLQRERNYKVTFERAIERMGLRYPFVKVAGVFRNDDLTVANLEGTFYNSEAGRVSKTYNFRSATENVEILKLAGIEAVSLGNNHTMDYGEKGAQSTVKTLNEAGIHWFGINEGVNGVYIFEKDGIKIGFMSVYYSYWAKGGRNSEKIKKNLTDLKKAKCDLIISSLHCGVEYATVHDNNQNKMAKWLFRNGADMVIGHHPHSIQGINVENGRTTFWSLGNFVFGGNPSLNNKLDGTLNIESFIAQIAFSFDETNRYLGHQINLIPVFISGTNKFNNFQPVLVTGDKANRVIACIQRDSYPLKLKPYAEGVGALQDFIPAPAGQP